MRKNDEYVIDYVSGDTCVKVANVKSVMFAKEMLQVQGRTQRGLEGGSTNPAGGLGGAVNLPAGSGAERRKILKLTRFRG